MSPFSVRVIEGCSINHPGKTHIRRDKQQKSLTCKSNRQMMSLLSENSPHF